MRTSWLISLLTLVSVSAQAQKSLPAPSSDPVVPGTVAPTSAVPTSAVPATPAAPPAPLSGIAAPVEPGATGFASAGIAQPDTAPSYAAAEQPAGTLTDEPKSATPASAGSPPAAALAASQPAATAAPPVVSFGPKGFNVQSEDGRFAFNIRFPFMFDAKATPSDDQPSSGDAFYPRFFGPILSTTIYQSVTGKLIVGFQDRSVTVVNAWLDVAAHPWLHVRVGKMLYAISLERQTLPLRIVFLEHGIASSLLGVSEFGAQLWGAAADRAFEYQLTFGNGAPANQHYETDLDNGKDAIGRVFLRPFARAGVPALAGFGLGFGGSYGVHRGAATTPLTGVSRTLGGRTFFATRADAMDPSATTVADGRVVRLVPQAAYVGGPVSVYTEYIRAIERLRNGSNRESVTNQSFHVVGSVVLTGEDAVLLDIVSPRKPLDVSAGQLGAFEVVGRFETIAFDSELFPTLADPAVSARSATALGGGLNWVPTDTVRLMIDYEHTRFRAAQEAPRLRAENLLGLRLQALF
jgi:phosphate-selective porin